MIYSLKERSALITGASQGLGLAIAQLYVKAGANVFLCARNTESLKRAKAQVKLLASPNQIVEARSVDVSNQDNVKSFVEDAVSIFPKISILINNAGIYGPMGKIEDVDWDTWVQAVNINLLGSIMMSRAVIPHFKKNNYGKIIQLSGGGATSPLPRISSYAASKAGIIRFAETLAMEVCDYNIDINSIAPGALNTSMLEEVLEAGPENVGEGFYSRACKQKKEGGVPIDKAAKLAVFLGSAESDGITGKLISALWDPWNDFVKYKKELNTSDVYTLRRIVAKDRGFDWED